MDTPTPNDVAQAHASATEESPAVEETTLSEEVTEDEGKSFEPITSQEQLDKVLGARLAREREKFADYDDLKAKVAEQDSAGEQAEQVQKENAELREQLTQQEVEINKQATAMKFNVPVELLQGTTREELIESAQALQDFAQSSQSAHEFVVDSVGSGTDATLTRDDIARQALGFTD